MKRILAAIFLSLALIASPVEAQSVKKVSSFTAASQDFVVTVDEYNQIVFGVSGTYGSVAFSFNVSYDNGTTYHTLRATRVDTGAVETASGTLTSTTRAWRANVIGATHIKLAETAWTSGTANLFVTSDKAFTELIMATVSTDPSSGLSQSVIPVSSADINGPATGLVGFAQYVSDTAETGSTTTVINATTHSANVRDAILFKSGPAQGSWSIVTAITTNTITVSPALRGTPANGNAFDILIPQPLYSGFASSTVLPSLSVNIGSSNQPSTASGILKLGDTATAVGDAGVKALAVRNEGAAVLADTNGDASGISVTRAGAVHVLMNSAFNGTSGGKDFIADEDVAFAASDAVGKVGVQAVSAITQLVGTTGDLTIPSADLGNRVVTTNAPAGETWWACTGEITTATNTQIKASVASNRHYITAFSCAPTSTNPNQIYLTDGSGGTAMDFVNTTSNAVAPGPQNTYPVPLRGSSATGVFVTTITTGAVRCCASGYISTI